METVFLLVWKMRQDIEFQKCRSQLQALLNQKGASEKQIQEAFEDLKNAFFPYDKYKKQNENKQLKEAMMREIARGALALAPMNNPYDKRNASKLARGAAALRKRTEMIRNRQQELDPFDKARRRRRPAS